MGERENGKKGKGLVKEHVCMTHGHGQWCGDGLWELGGGGWQHGGRQRGKIWDNCNRITIKSFSFKENKLVYETSY